LIEECYITINSIVYYNLVLLSSILIEKYYIKSH